MRRMKRLFQWRKSVRSEDALAPTSLLAFSQLNGAEQKIMADVLLASTIEAQPYRRAS